jgi:hypothetical protein
MKMGRPKIPSRKRGNGSAEHARRQCMPGVENPDERFWRCAFVSCAPDFYAVQPRGSR